MIKARLAGALLLCLALRVGAGPPWTPSTFPNPKLDIDKCGRGVPSNICDPDQVISTAAANRVEGILKEIYEGADPYARAPCGSKGLEGYQVAVALMRSMDIPAGESAESEAAAFARQLHDSWGVGDAACNNGVLLLLSIGDRQVYISTGKGAAEALPNSHIASIINALKPLLRKGAYDDAVEQAVVDIGLGLAGRGREDGEGGGVDWFVVGFFGLVAALIFNSCRRSWLRHREYRDCKRMLAKLKREQDQIRHHAWSAPPSCPICLEDFVPPPPGTRATNSGAGSAGEDMLGGADREEGPSGSGSSSGGGGLRAAAPPEDSPSTSLLVGERSDTHHREAAGCCAGASSAAACEGGSDAESCSQRSGIRRRSVGKGLGGEGEGAAGGAAPPLRRPITLACGHTFCDPCLTTWLQQKTTCPICRDKIGNCDPREGKLPRDAAQAAANANQPGSSGAGDAQRLLNEFWAMELAFRLGSLQRMYPGYVSPTMADQWASEARETGTFNWEASREFQLRDPSIRAQHESHGSSGFSTSFGGGSSYGGGGGGGSW